MTGSRPDAANVDYNLYYAPNSNSVGSIDDSGKTWEEWKSAGHEESGLNADPLLTTDFELGAGSPAIDRGVALSIHYKTDKNGTIRPQGSGWDMGAYEFSEPCQAQKFMLYQNYPNPFNPMTTIRFVLKQSYFVELKMYDIRGREIETLISGIREAGAHDLDWNTGDLPSGIYLYRLKAGGYVETRKVILQK